MKSVHHRLDPALHAALHAAIGSDMGSVTGIDAATEIAGGSISRALVVESGERRYFVKLNDA
ncbi:MAG: hypothetical protein KBE22_15530, partial [Candidatus Accumulibacter sp.]|nr:hypothetical protein [Accumulibacter sp.]